MAEPAAARPADPSAVPHRVRRRATALAAALLLVWAVTSFAAPVLLRGSDLRLFGWPLAYWMSAQGSLWVYLAVTVAYAVVMNRLEDDPARPENGD